ncbi:MAG TPA: tripartite tricarboxylate transporter permease [Candidatus Methylomirabilis sp.]|nr:tripartite tricarboxylate transporter permease [Candidatus Methylomirabilis sp.]
MQDILNGFAVALSLNNLFYCFLGALWGTMVGVLPGIGPLAGTAILIPLTFKLDPTGAIIMLAAIYYGSQYGGTITTVLMGVPGEASSAITMIDGYQMAKQGRGGVALTGAAIGSFIGGTFATICLMLLAKPVVKLALKLGPPEYFALMIVGLSMATGLAGKSMVKALIMTVFGALLALVGLDPVVGTPRLTFGSVHLLEGIELLSVVMGLFGMSEVLLSLEEKARPMIETKLRELIPTRQDVRNCVKPIVRGTLIGTALGVIPGLIPPVSSFLSYAIERRSSKTPEKFGHGMLEGVVGPETANNGHASAAMMPLLTLGIPTNPVMAVILGAFIINGLAPGPLLFEQNPNMVWGIIASCYIGNFMLVILNLPLIPMWVQILRIPYAYLMTAILAFMMVGSYSDHNSIFNVGQTIVFGALGYIFKKMDFPLAPVALSFILAPMIEKSLYRSLVMSPGDISILYTRPISASLLALALCTLIYFSTQKKAQVVRTGTVA